MNNLGHISDAKDIVTLEYLQGYYAGGKGANPYINLAYLNDNLRGRNGGIAPLDDNGKVPMSNIPDTILGQVVFGGTVNFANDILTATIREELKRKLGTTASTIVIKNSATGNYGYQQLDAVFFLAGNAFTFAGMTFDVGDWLISIGTAWKKIDNTDAVTSVNGKIGAVTLTLTDIMGNTKIADSFIASATTWNAKYDKPSGGIPKTDLASDVQTSLGLADTAFQKESFTAKNIVDTLDTTAVNRATGDASGNNIASTYATKTQLSDGSVTKIGTTDVGSATQPMYLKAGVPTAITGAIGNDTTGNAATATTLKTTRKIWGRDFNGSGDVSGAIENATTGAFSSNVTVGGTLKIGKATLTWDESHQCIVIDKGFASDSFISAGGINTEAGGGGSDYPRLDTWAAWNNWSASDKAAGVLSAKLGVELHNTCGNFETRIAALEAKPDVPAGVLTISNYAATLDNAYASLASEMVISNGIAALDNRVSSIEAWKSRPTIEVAEFNELNILGFINLNGEYLDGSKLSGITTNISTLQGYFNNGVAKDTEKLGGTAASSYLKTSDIAAWAKKSSLAASDVPNLDWSKITTGKPTTLAGYGITDAPTKTGGGATGTWDIGISGNAATATTATNLANKPSLSFTAATSSSAGSTLTVTAGGKTSDLVTIGKVRAAFVADTATETERILSNAIAQHETRIGSLQDFLKDPKYIELLVQMLKVLEGINLGGIQIYTDASGTLQIAGAVRVSGALTATGAIHTNGSLSTSGDIIIGENTK